MKFNIRNYIPQFHFFIERWKYYQPLNILVSTEGRIKSLDGEIQSVCSKNNYLYYRGQAVHRIVLSTFHPIPNWAELTVDHINHNTRDNSLHNLTWMTLEENQTKARKDDAKHQPTIIEKAPVVERKIKVNGVTLTIEQAQSLMKSDTSLDYIKSKRLIDRVYQGECAEAKYGNWKVTPCK